MELRCNINCGGGERDNNNVPQRSAQRSRAPRRHERTSERARTHADATTLVVFAPQEKEVGAQAPQECGEQTGPAPAMPMHASKFDIKLFTSVVTNPSSKKYLEFKCGGSTEIVASKTKLQIVSVDSSTEWLCKVRHRVQSLGRQNNFTAVHVNIGQLKNWGHPKDKQFVHAWPDYSSVSKNHTDADVVFVDGRFRVACILQTILHARNDPTIVVHDFWERSGYHEALEFLHVVNKGDSLMTATIKPNFDRQACRKLLAKHMLNPNRM